MNILQSPDLYLLIRSYLQGNDYQKLMDTNKAKFREIKKETINYQVIIVDKLERTALNEINQIIQFVKNPRRQVGVLLFMTPPREMNKILEISPCLHILDIRTHDQIFTNDDIDFNLFNNIPVVKLYGFKGVTKITKGLQNIQDLLLRLDDLEEIHDFTEIGCLEKLVLELSSSLKRFGKFHRGDHNEILSKILFSTGPEDIRNIQFQANRLEMRSLSLSHIQEIDISTNNNHPLDFSLFTHIPSVALSGPADCHFPENCHFYGKRLKLTSFNLSSWNHSHHDRSHQQPRQQLQFPNITSLELKHCTNLRQFPLMPQLQELKLMNLSSLTFIPTFFTLHKLHLIYLKDLVRISSQPYLHSLTCWSCDLIENFQEFDGQIFSFVFLCLKQLEKHISIFRNAYSLEIKLCQVPNQLGIKDSIISVNKRSFSLCGFPEDLPLSHLFKLEFHHVHFLQTERKKDLHEYVFHDIAYLYFISCSGRLPSFGNITHGLVIDDFKGLPSLYPGRLSHLPRLFLCNLPDLEDISSLNDHEHVYVSEVPILVDASRSYSRDLRKGKQEENEYDYELSTIKALTVIAPKGSNEEEDAFHFKDWDTTLRGFPHKRLW